MKKMMPTSVDVPFSVRQMMSQFVLFQMVSASCKTGFSSVSSATKCCQPASGAKFAILCVKKMLVNFIVIMRVERQEKLFDLLKCKRFK